MKSPVFLTLCAGILGVVSSTAQASLIDRGGGLIYDDDLNITWLADANYSFTSGYDADGRMTWSQATTWAADLVYHDSVRDVDYTDWRLPFSLQPDAGCSQQNTQLPSFSGGYSCTGSEMGHLYFTELGGVAGGSAPSFGPFQNVQAAQYWTGTTYTLDSSIGIYFPMTHGYQSPADKEGNQYAAWAVRGGDVVPAPATVWLMTTAIGFLVPWAARRKRKSAI